MTLVILAAGMGSRFGGLKQMEPMGPNGEFIIDYSIYDAIRVGFDKVVFVIKEEMLKDFEDTILSRIKDKISVEIVFQKQEEMPLKTKVERIKPWGTGQALYACKDAVKENFMVLNADDFYGRDAFVKASKFLKDEITDIDFGNVCFKVANTLTDNGEVKRGVCTAQDGLLISLKECRVKKIDKKIVCTPLDESESFEVNDTAFVNMNMLLFTPKIFDYLESDINLFVRDIKDPLKDEYILTDVIDRHIKNGDIKMHVIETNSKWFGVTYKEDKDYVKKSINELINDGVYPRDL